LNKIIYTYRLWIKQN